VSIVGCEHRVGATPRPYYTTHDLKRESRLGGTASCIDTLIQELVSELRRNLNRLNEHNIAVRREAIKELHQTIISQQLNARIFQQVAELLLKGLLKSFSDESEVVREFAVLIVIELITRCEEADPFLSYVLSVLADRTNSSDL